LHGCSMTSVFFMLTVRPKRVAAVQKRVNSCWASASEWVTKVRVARYPVFQGSSRISAPISRLPERSYPGDEISRISIRTCQSPVTTHGDTLYGPCIVAIAYMVTMQIMCNSTVCYIIQHTVRLRTLRSVVPQTSVVPHSEH